MGHWIAASLVGGERWQTGVTLMQKDDPAALDRLMQLSEACGDVPAGLCEAAIVMESKYKTDSDSR